MIGNTLPMRRLFPVESVRRVQTRGALIRAASICLLALLITGCGITASSRNAGFASFSSGDLPGLQKDTSISLGPTVLRFAARHSDEDPAAQAILKAIDGIQIKVFTLEQSADRVALAAALNEDAAGLDENWQPIVRVNEPDSTVHILLKQSDDAILGLAILAVDDEELVFVNVMGELSPDMLAELGHALPDEQTVALKYLPLH